MTRGFSRNRPPGSQLRLLPAAGIPVQITSDSTPTPAVSFAVKSQGAAGGVVVTSSHNPWNWNGVKFKAKFGGSATPAIMKVIEEEVSAGSMPKGTRGSDQRGRSEAGLRGSHQQIRGP